MKIAVACYTFVGRCSGCPSPWMIKVERLAFLAFSTIRIVLTVTGQLTVLVVFASAGVTIALTSPSNSQVRH